jgi:hypothetical protein
MCFYVVVVGQNPPASSDRQHEEREASETAGGSRSLGQRPRSPAHALAGEVLGMPPDLYLTRKV